VMFYRDAPANSDPAQRPTLAGVGGLPVFYGGVYPTRIWTAFMTSALQGMPVEAFAAPPTPVPTETSPSPSKSPKPTPTTSSPTPTPTPTPTSPSPSVTPSTSPSVTPSTSPAAPAGRVSVGAG
jgi:membrane peptidoglycan carboxypeptidase